MSSIFSTKLGMRSRGYLKLLAASSMLGGCAVFAPIAYAGPGDFVNGGFETGDLTGWTTSGGYRGNGAGAVTPADYSGAANSVTVVSQGLDPITNDPMVFAGNNAVRINDSNNNYSVNAITQTVTNYSANTLYVAWSAVLDAAHLESEASTMHIVVSDVTNGGNVALIDETYNASTSSVNLNAFKSVSNRSSVLYSGWVVDKISTIAGHDYTITVYAADCVYSGHFGYAYLDTFSQTVPTPNAGVNPGTSAGGQVAPAANYWQGGLGTWDLSTTNWTDAANVASGTYLASGGPAVFRGTAGTVTVSNNGTPIDVTGLQFRANGYLVQGDGLKLAASPVDIAVGDGTSAGAAYIATVNSPISGSGMLTKSDLGTLILGGVNSYSGGTTVYSGKLSSAASGLGSGAIAISNGATLDINQSADATLANSITGTGTFTKTGTGQLLLTGNSTGFTGSTLVQAGRLRVDGNLANSAITVASGASVGGYGTLGAIDFGAGSTLAPGGSIGTLNVAGNVTQRAGSTYALEVASTGQSDLINIGGTLTLESGAKLVVTKTDSGVYQLNRRYTVLTAGGGITGSYTVSGDTAVSYFYNVVPTKSGNALYMDVAQTRSFASAALTPNQRSVAQAADAANSRVAIGTVIGGSTLQGALGYLQSAAAAQQAFDAISGEVHASARSSSFADSAVVRDAVLGSAQQDGAFSHQIWGHAYGHNGSRDSDGNAASYTHDATGIVAGIDLLTRPNFALGAFGGSGQGKTMLLARGSSANADDVHYGAYARLRHGAVSIDAGYGHTDRTISTTRSIAIGSLSETARARYTIDVDQAFGQVGLHLGKGRFQLEPQAGLAYVAVKSGSAGEVAVNTALQVSKGSNYGLYGQIGGRLIAKIVSGDAVDVRLDAGAQLRHTLGSDAIVVNNSLASGDNFQVSAQSQAKDVLVYDIGLEANLAKQVSLSVAYTGVKGDGIAQDGAKATLRVRF